jgi:hypothetical protein
MCLLDLNFILADKNKQDCASKCLKAMLGILTGIFLFISLGIFIFFVLQTNSNDFWANFLSSTSMIEGVLIVFLW